MENEEGGKWQGVREKADSEPFHTPRKHHSGGSRNKKDNSKNYEDHVGEIGAKVNWIMEVL